MIYPWQQSQWLQFQQQRNLDRISQGMLLSGSEGLGQLVFANAVAQLQLCEQAQDYACGNCRQCHLYLAGNHPDLLFVSPEEIGKAIKVDQVRQLIAQVSQTPQIATSQVVIIHPAEAMNEKAANALLKTLEEPMGNVIFLLVCYRPALLPITVVSRCQRLHFTTPDKESTLSWLKKQGDANRDLELNLKLALGAPLKAKELIENNSIAVRDELIQALLLSWNKKNPMSHAASLAKLDLAYVLLFWRLVLQDVRQLQCGVDICNLVNFDKSAELQKLCTQMSVAQCQFQLDELTRLESIWRDRIALNWTLAFESLLLYPHRADALYIAQ